jgi:ankyrin repeat protein
MDGSPTAGWTALHQAASRGNIKMVEDLIKAGADIARKDAAGAVPADIARVKAVLQWLTP